MRGFSRFALLAAAALACRTPQPLPGFVFPVPGRQPEFAVHSSRVWAAGTLAEVVISAPSGIFQAELDFSNGKPAKLTLIVLREKTCEGLSFKPKDGPWRGLKGTPGVKVFRRGDDLAVELGPQALADMGRGGRIQFINLYR